MNISFNSSGRRPKSPLGQFFAALLGLLVLGAALMFSLVFVAVLAVAGLVFWLYFWWKTRAIRKQFEAQLREPEFSSSAPTPKSEGDVIEGQAVRVADERDKLPG